MGVLQRISKGLRTPPDQPIVHRVEPLEGTNISLFNTIIPSWWQENGLSSASSYPPGDGRLAERVWVASRCVQMNAQQIASMPLNFEGATEPAWVSSPDPSWYPNGISDAVFSVAAQVYAWGFACLYVTDFYADGYPRTWTVLPSSRLDVKMSEYGSRQYKLGEKYLDARRVVQIDRNPGYDVKGCSALRAYAQQCWGLLAAGNLSMNVSQGGIPQTVLRNVKKRLTKDQAEAAQTQWMEATMRRNGAPPVLDIEWEFDKLSFDPKDLALLEVQDFNAKAIATAFGVPAVLLNMSLDGGLTYTNVAQMGEQWWRYELRPTAKRIADALTAQMLPAGQYVWFDAEDTILPVASNDGPLATDENDPQAATPGVAKASPGPLSVVPSPQAISTGR